MIMNGEKMSIWRENVAVYFEVTSQYSPRVNEENPEDISHDKR
jgi:hypothetical protein